MPAQPTRRKGLAGYGLSIASQGHETPASLSVAATPAASTAEATDRALADFRCVLFTFLDLRCATELHVGACEGLAFVGRNGRAASKHSEPERAQQEEKLRQGALGGQTIGDDPSMVR